MYILKVNLTKPQGLSNKEIYVYVYIYIYVRLLRNVVIP